MYVCMYVYMYSSPENFNTLIRSSEIPFCDSEHNFSIITVPNDASKDLEMPHNMSIIIQYIKTHTVVLWFSVYSVRILARRRHHGCFFAKLYNAMDACSSEQVHGLSLFSRGCCQVLLKSAQCAMPSLTFCRCNCIVVEIRSKRCISLERIHGQAVNCTTRKVFLRIEPLAPPTEKPPHENLGWL